MRFKQVGNKQDTVSLVVRSAESSLTIAQGNPVSLVMNGTQDGLAVVLPVTATAAKGTALAFGVAHAAINPNDYGEVQIFGFCNKVKYARARTRAASTDAYASTAAMSVGQQLLIDTVNNAFYPGAAQAASAFMPYAVICETLDSLDSVASTSSVTAVASYATGFCKAFLRMM